MTCPDVQLLLESGSTSIDGNANMNNQMLEFSQFLNFLDAQYSVESSMMSILEHANVNDELRLLNRS